MSFKCSYSSGSSRQRDYYKLDALPPALSTSVTGTASHIGTLKASKTLQGADELVACAPSHVMLEMLGKSVVAIACLQGKFLMRPSLSFEGDEYGLAKIGFYPRTYDT